MGFSIYSPPPIPRDEPERRAAIVASGLLDRHADPDIQDVVRFTSGLFGGIMSAVTVIIDTRQILLAAEKIPPHEMSRDISICGYTILQPAATFCVLDTLADPRFRENPIVTDEPNVRFYLGAPLMIGESIAAGALCVFDAEPRSAVSPAERDRLRELAGLIVEIATARGPSPRLDFGSSS